MTTGTLPRPPRNLSTMSKSQKNASSAFSAMTDPSATYDYRVAHAETIKVVNNRYSTPVTLKCAAVTKERTVNIAQKNVIIFAMIKLLDLTATIKSTKGIVYYQIKDFPYSQAYQDAFEDIVDKYTRPKPHIYVKHIIESTLQID